MGFAVFTYFAGETVSFTLGEPSTGDPQTVSMAVDSIVVATTSFPGTVSYVIPSDEEIAVAFFVDQGTATWDVNCAAAPDTTAPTIAITTPADGATYTLGQIVNADYSCEDEAGGSGVASCVGDVANGGPIDTSTVGSKTFTVNAEDNAGNPASLTHNYSVVYNFSGFFQPVDNTPTFNVVKAGARVPIKFSLSGDQGLNIFAAGYPTSVQVVCPPNASLDVIEQTLKSGGSSLSYDPLTDTYNYKWKTDKAWAGTCRQLIVRLNDGTDHIANFMFK